MSAATLKCGHHLNISIADEDRGSVCGLFVGTVKIRVKQRLIHKFDTSIRVSRSPCVDAVSIRVRLIAITNAGRRESRSRHRLAKAIVHRALDNTENGSDERSLKNLH